MSASITFPNYPASNRVPGAFADFDSSKANTATQNLRTLIVGQMLATGTAVSGTPALAAGLGDVQAKYGMGSELAQMYQFYRLSDKFREVWCLPVADPQDTKASITLTPAGTTSGSGVIYLYIAGSPINPVVPVVLYNGMTAIEVGTAIAAAVNAIPTMPVTASVSSATGAVTLTSVHAGLIGNQIDVRLNYRGAAAGESIPNGITITFSGGTQAGSGYFLAGGSVNPQISAALANLAGDKTFDFIINPYTDAANLATMTLFLDDQTGRWSWQQELFGGAWGVFAGTLAALTTFGNSMNDQHTQIMGIYDSPTPAYLWATDVTANCAVSVASNPAIPLQYLSLNVYPPSLENRFDPSERNTLLYDGISTFIVDDSGTVQIERMCTTYQKNAAGAADNSYLDTETLYTLAAGISDLRTFIQSNYLTGKILVSDGSRIPYGSAMVTAQTILTGVIGRYQTHCTIGWAQNPKQFAQQALAQNAGNGLVKLMLPYMVANQLRQVAMLVQFTKP